MEVQKSAFSARLLNSGPVFAKGYRYGEVVQDTLKPVKQDVFCVINPDATTVPPLDRPDVSVSLGCHVRGAALPHVDPSDLVTCLAGVSKRVASKPPDADPVLIGELREFVDKFCRKHFVPLAPDSDTSVRAWLEKVPYSNKRKMELIAKWDRVRDKSLLLKKFAVVKQFVKDETYEEFKYARQINSRSDEFKCAVGPIFKLIEKEVFKLKYFIKKIPVAQRPEYILDMLQLIGSKYYPTDYSSFEALFVENLMTNCEEVLYRHMVQHLPDGEQFLGLFTGAIKAENRCTAKHFTTYVEATRMSGEMNTSLGNGFTNLMVLLFVAEKLGAKDIDAVVEGDDSLSNPHDAVLTTELFTKLGLIIKLESMDSVARASFCGLVFDEYERRNVTDPRSALCGFGWTKMLHVKSSEKTKMALLRCTSLSLAYQYPGCPILSALARYGLKMTRSYDVRPMIQKWKNMYEKEQLIEALRHPIINVEVGIKTRQLVQELYGISIDEQKEIEKYLDNLDEITELDHPYIRAHMKQEWEYYYTKYCGQKPELDNRVYHMNRKPIPLKIYRRVAVGQYLEVDI